MSEKLIGLKQELESSLSGKVTEVVLAHGEVTVTVPAANLLDVARYLHDSNSTEFTQLTDLCGIDYLAYGDSEWDVSGSGFSRGVKRDFSFDIDDDEEESVEFDGQRYAVIIHLLSVNKNMRIRLKVFCEDNDFPRMDSLTQVWNSANWFEREAFDLFGILFDGHPDLRRILTDYGFVGYPFRKDFPMLGQVEMRYDEEQKRVIYEPVSVESRTLVPRVIRATEGSSVDMKEVQAVDEAQSEASK